MYGVHNIKNRVLGTMFIVKAILQIIRIVILVELTQSSAHLSGIWVLQWLTFGSFLQRQIQMSIHIVSRQLSQPFSPRPGLLQD